MKIKFPPAIVALCIITFTGCVPSSSATSPRSIADLDAFITEQVKTSIYPGLAVAIVLDDKIVWSKGYGVTNLKTRAPVTTDTPFMIASVSKVVTGTALMQLVEAGKIDLDADINTYLPFRIENPRAPGKITLRHLATHTSGLVDFTPTLAASYGAGDSAISLEEFLKSYYVPGGSRYDTTKNFADTKPGEKFEYTNIGIALTAYLLERRTGASFDSFTNAQIFKPLGMTNTHWFLRDFKDVGSIAFPYDSEHPDLTHYGYPTYPDGQLRSSVNDMAKFLRAVMNAGSLDGTKILEPKTLQAMLEPQFPNAEKDEDQGLFWAFKKGLIGHAGGDPGTSSYMYWNPETRIGTVVMANTAITPKNPSGMVNILKTILRDPATVKLFR
jgi:CubicO group peptidase (beta-lactamase class C family)